MTDETHHKLAIIALVILLTVAAIALFNLIDPLL